MNGIIVSAKGKDMTFRNVEIEFILKLSSISKDSPNLVGEFEYLESS